MRSPARLALTLSCLLLLVSAATAGERAAEITGDAVRMRAGPGTVHAVLGELNRGDLVVVLGEEGSWKKVLVPGGFPCWVHGSLVEIDPAGTALVTATDVLLRPTAGKTILPLDSKVTRGDVLTVLDRDGEWVKVIAPDRAHLYVYGDYVRDLGPVEDNRARVERAARERHDRLTGERTEEADRAVAERRRREDRDLVLRFGEEVLEGSGDAEGMRKELTRIVLESDDDLTRGYANSLLALLELRTEAERLRVEVERARREKDAELSRLSDDLKAAQGRFEAALSKMRELRLMRESPFRGVGRIEKRGADLVLVDGEKVLFRVLSRRFRLEDYVGRRVGVNGRMVVTDEETGVRHLMVEKLEIVEPESDGR